MAADLNFSKNQTFSDPYQSIQVSQTNRAIIASILILLQVGVAVQPTAAQSRAKCIVKLEDFLVNQFDPEIGLVRESPDASVRPVYWLVSDNLLAMHALKPHRPDIADKINATLHKYGRFKDGLHEALFGEVIQIPPYTPQVTLLENNTRWAIQAEERNSSGKPMDDWIDYADILLYAALSYHNKDRDEIALHHFDQVVDMWNGIGLYDKPTRQPYSCT